MRLIDADALEEHKFVGIKFVQIGGRTNGKTLESINKAYQQGWNDCIDAIIDNAPTVDISETISKFRNTAYKNGFTTGLNKRPQGEWITVKQDTILGTFDVNNKVCDQCNHATKYEYPFCPWCGADMRGNKE